LIDPRRYRAQGRCPSPHKVLIAPEHGPGLPMAKERSSAIKRGPQLISNRDVEAVIVLSYAEYRKALLNQKKLSDFFRESPLAKVGLDLRRNKIGLRP